MWDFIRKIFGQRKRNQSIINKYGLNTDSRFKKKPEEDGEGINSIQLEKGKRIDIIVPDFLIKANRVLVTDYKFKLGETINEGEVLCELETEDLSFEFESFCTGKIVYINSNKRVIANEKIITLEGV
ncbi:hypothetical protein WH52_00375 [Tenacibaculum holothuriorum]|uniref:Lipoyl-binding domain-containing protein n=1 Tax=Tenacibaculum holothuriorum TaxID=1635173 RepID=A0A1Y2PHJ1_9FLAO|nr:lipoyl domain-containing protein [Tenacibaculum holothuriorum]OSY89148.1 hypothetical protein WH52_00375 [Tenacibaculum holothuriorum]